jgi:hypothetical protein
MSDETQQRQAIVAAVCPAEQVSSFLHGKHDDLVKQEAGRTEFDASPTALAEADESSKQFQENGVTKNSPKLEIEVAPEPSEDSKAFLSAESREDPLENITRNGSVCASKGQVPANKVQIPAKEVGIVVVKSPPEFTASQGKRKRSPLDHADAGEIEQVQKAQRCDSVAQTPKHSTRTLLRIIMSTPKSQSL